MTARIRACFAEDGSVILPSCGHNLSAVRHIRARSDAGQGVCMRVGCTKPAAVQCARCHEQQYCSQACQTTAWSVDGHDGDCVLHLVDIMTSLRVGASTGEDLIASLTKAYTWDSTTTPQPTFYNGMAIEFLTADSAQVADIMRTRMRVISGVAAAHHEVLTTYDDHEINHGRIDAWIKRLDKFPAALQQFKDNLLVMDDAPNMTVTLEKTWPEYEPAEAPDADEPVITDYDIEVGHEMRLEDWVEKMTSPEALAFARGFRASLQYVSRPEFIDTAISTMREVIRGAQHGNSKIVWVNYYGANRSASWLMLILWNHFKDSIDAVVASFTELHALASAPQLAAEYANVVAIVPDDASYTGQQLAHKLRVYGARLGKFKSSANIEIVVAVPYASTMAREEIFSYVNRFHYAKGVAISYNTPGSDKMRTLEEHFSNTGNGHVPGDIYIPADTDWLPSLRAVAAAFVHRTRPDHVPVYFAHKLADHVSVPNHLIAVAPYPVIVNNHSIVIKSTSFIKGCRSANFVYARAAPDAPVMEHANDFVQEEGKVCPFPIYKKTQLAYEGRPIATNENIVLWADAYA